MRANLLDELQKAYVTVARAKGLSERKLLYKYPFRMAINPIVSTIGWTLPALVNGELLASFVLGHTNLSSRILNFTLAAGYVPGRKYYYGIKYSDSSRNSYLGYTFDLVGSPNKRVYLKNRKKNG